MRAARAVWLVLALARAAGASPAYPQVIKDRYSLAADPACTLCHETDSGGTGTVKKPFGLTLESFGLHSKSPASLAQALEQSETLESDSDGDGDSDVAELRAGTDPNVPSGDGGTVVPPPPPGVEGPQHGCSAAPVGPGNSGVLGALAVLGGLLAATRRHGRRGMGTQRGRTATKRHEIIIQGAGNRT